MIALTARLNERDETIIQLQEELDAYDRYNKETQTLAHRRKSRIARLEQALQDNGLPLPVGDEEVSNNEEEEEEDAGSSFYGEHEEIK